MATPGDQIIETPENRSEDEAIKLALEASSSSENEESYVIDGHGIVTPPITSDKKKKRAESRRKSLDPNR